MLHECHLELLRGGARLASYPLTPFGLTAGSARGCDIRVPEDGCPPVTLLIRARRGTVTSSRLHSPTGRTREAHLPYGAPLHLWGPYTLRRAEPTLREGRREPVVPSAPSTMDDPHIIVGSVASERRFKLSARGLTIGRGEDCDVRLMDRYVADKHCWLVRAPMGVVVRDLGSRGGVWANGVRVDSALLAHGAHLRLGRTDLYIDGRPSGPKLGGAGDPSLGQVVRSPALTRVKQLAHRYADLPWPVLVRGESGVGKEAVATWLHQGGSRACQPFVRVNAGGISDSLMDAQLFGYQRGAFTGAERDHPGFFEQAADGTLFLDEVGELSPSAQVRLLRVLESQKVRRVGGEREVAVQARIVCATHRDLETMVRDGDFRADLYFRLSQLELHVPPLRQRPDDLDGLIDHFVALAAEHVGERRISRAARAKLCAAAWPGNARELRNVIRAAAAACPATVIDTPDIEPLLRRAEKRRPPQRAPKWDQGHLQAAFRANDGNMARTARELGMPRSTLRDRLRSRVEPGPRITDR